MYTPTQVEQIIKDYCWMDNLIKSGIFEYDSTSTAQYGIESTMPKGTGTGDKVYMRVLKNDKQGKKYKEMIARMSYINEHESLITNEKDYYILQLLKRGKNFKEIGIIMECSNVNIYHRLQKIAKTIAEHSIT